MRNKISNMQYLLFALLMFILTACGTSNPNTAGTANLTGSGKVTANLILPNKSAAKTVGSVADVTKTRLTVTGATIPTARGEFTSATGGSVEVYPGDNLIVNAQAFDTNGNFLYEGFATNVKVVAGPTPTTVTIQLNAPVVKAADTACLTCHETTRDVTGQNLVADYKQSGHYVNTSWTIALPKNGATQPGCAGCHGTQHNDPNPSASGRCYECHSAGFYPSHTTFYTYNGTSIVGNTCTQCHQAHNSKAGLPADYKASAHGDPAGLAWQTNGHNWRTSGSAVDFSTTIPVSDCVRCHTSDGFVQFTTAPQFTNVNVLGGDGTVSSPLVCSACHTAGINTFATPRAVAAVKTFYNISSVDKVTKKTIKSRIAGNYPDVGQSNICNSCHSARVVGPNLTQLFATGNWDLTNASFQNSHYMAASGNMYMKTGFKNFTTLTAPAPKNLVGTSFSSNQTYDQTLSALNTTTPDGVVGGQNSAHRRLGTPLLAGSESYLPAGGTALTTNGPCVTCHMKAFNPVAGNGFTPPAAGRPGAGHSLKIDEATAQQLCLQCHADAPHLDGGTGTGVGLYTTMKNLADIEKAMLEPQSTAFQNGLTLIKQILLVKYQINFDSTAYPYFYDMQKDATGKTAVTDWTRKLVNTTATVTALADANITAIPAGGLTQVQAYRLMGACFNLNVLARDPGAFVHARTYSQRLVFDTVDFLDNNLMDFTAVTSARTLNPAVYSGFESNVLVAAPVGGLATESMAWLAGTHYTDTKGTTPTALRLRP